MAKEKEGLTVKERSEFTLEKVASATKWIVLSGTATYFLLEVAKILEEVNLPTWAVLLSNLVVNVAIFGIAKYVEGEGGK
jgi:uncharacterized membrane protein (DUF2068 family)